MTGFKSGASDDDPLGTDDPESEGERDSSRPAEQSVSPDPPQSSAGDALPWIYSRNSITDGRPNTVQLHLQQSTLEREQDALRDVPIDESVNKADFREAAYVVGLANLDDVARQLREWGYDL